MYLHIIKRVHEVSTVKNSNNSSIPPYLKEYSDCFGELGCFPTTHHIFVDPNIQPTKYPARRIPISLQTKLYDELQHMVKLKVIIPVEEPTEWSNSFVAVEKPDHSLRICLDRRELNKAINTPDFKLPTTEEVIAKIGTSK